MKKNTPHSFLIIGLLLCCCFSARATHIVGGEMNYRCLGNNQYEISLTVFRDCDTGVPWFDTPASIGIFDAVTNLSISSVNVNWNNAINDTLEIYLPDSCLIVPSNVCIHTTTYTTIVTLPYRASGYIISYQRCCRNQDIVNIVDPDATGATYWTYVSPQALLLCNTSAVFKEWPRVYLCSGVPIEFDHSAYDADGDSIVYELCTPSHGANTGNPMPQPPYNPPYPTIVWQPPYNMNNMFGGPDPLKINAATGLLTGTPQALGVFLVGVCLKEYRNGVLISITRRDFQHVIGTCQRQTIANFDTTGLQCNTNLVFPFDNNSQVVTGTYNWLFDTLATTTAVNPTYTFPDTGTYTITLVAGIGSPCIDTFSVDMNIQIEAIDLTITPPQTVCHGDTVLLVARDLYQGYSDSVNYFWTPDSVIIRGQGTDSIWYVADINRQFYVGALNSYGCFDNAITVVNVQRVEASFDTTIVPCNTSLAMQFLNTSTSNPLNNNYRWTFGNLGTATGTHQNFTFPSTGTYTVSLIAGLNSLCPDTFSMDVNVAITGIDVLPIPSRTLCFGDSIWAFANNVYSNYTNPTYTWTPNSSISTGQGTDSVLIVANNSGPIKVVLENSFGCKDSTSFNIGVIAVEAAFDTVELACNTSLIIPFINRSTTNQAAGNYQWQFGNFSNSTAISPTITFPDTGSYVVTLIAGGGTLCPDTVVWDLYLPLYGVNLTTVLPQTVCAGDSLWLKVSDILEQYSDFINYTWTPSTSILAGQGTDSVLVVANSSTTFQVAAINSHQCQDSTTVLISTLEVAANFDTISLICNTSLVIPFVNNSTSNSTNNNNFLWSFDNLGTSTITNPSYTFPDTGTYNVSLIADIAGMCPDTFNRLVYLPLHGLDISASNAQVICKGDTVLLVATNTLSAYTNFTNYQWSPAASIVSGQGTDSVYAIVDSDTTFNVIAINSHFCQDTTQSFGSIIYISPAVNISSNPDSVFVGQTAQLDATNDINYSYNWLIDTTLSDCFIYNPIAKPRNPTTYYLTTTNQYGCRTLDSVMVFIKEPICGMPIVFIPNAFSPDGDGHNDILYVNGNNIREMNLAIYNRWGQKVFETNDPNIGWNGTFNGQLLAPDVYGYYLQCICDDGGTLFTKGNITLLK